MDSNKEAPNLGATQSKENSAMNRLAILAASAAAAFAATGVSAKAGCYQPDATPNVVTTIPRIPAVAPSATGAQTIVGLWHVAHKTNGKLFFESLEQWHSDGAEFEFANIPPASGDICLGEWTKTAAGKIALYHIGWTFDPTGKSTGTLLLTATYTLNAKATAFTGPFDAKFLNTTGKVVNEVKGYTSATRLPAS